MDTKSIESIRRTALRQGLIIGLGTGVIVTFVISIFIAEKKQMANWK